MKRGRWSKSELDVVARYAHCTRTTKEDCIKSLSVAFRRNPKSIDRKYAEALLQPAPPPIKAKENRLLVEVNDHSIIIKIWRET